MHVWNLVLLFKVDVDWFQLWAGEFSGRQMREMDQLAGKEITDMLQAAERYRFDGGEEQRRGNMWQSDPSSCWHEVCEEYVQTGRCLHGSSCRRIHCRRRGM